jgi:hypothetical protein
MGAVHATTMGVDCVEKCSPSLLTTHRSSDSGLSTDNTGREGGRLSAASGQQMHLKPPKHAQQRRPLEVSEHADAGRSVSSVPNSASALPAAAFPASASISATNSMNLGAQNVSRTDSVEYPAVWAPPSDFVLQSTFASVCCLSDCNNSPVLGEILDACDSDQRFRTAPQRIINKQMLGHTLFRELCVRGTHSHVTHRRRRQPCQVESQYLASNLAAIPIMCCQEEVDMCTKVEGLSHVVQAQQTRKSSTCLAFSQHLALFVFLFFIMTSNATCIPVPKPNMFIRHAMPLLEGSSFGSEVSVRAHAITHAAFSVEGNSLFHQQSHAGSNTPSLLDTCMLVKRAIFALVLESHERMASKIELVGHLGETDRSDKKVLFQSECETSVADARLELSGSWLGKRNVVGRVLKFHHCLVMVRRSLNLKGGSGQDGDGDGGSVSRGSHSPDA